MTRDDAIKKATENYKLGEGAPAQFVDLAVALGMLKLEEPKSDAEEKFKEAFRHWPHGWRGVDALRDLDMRGLKIVEK